MSEFWRDACPFDNNLNNINYKSLLYRFILFNVLEDAYIIAIDLDNQHADYDGTTFSTILDNDHAFIDRYFS
jgi:hypothetical protein